MSGPMPCPACPHGLGFNCRQCWPKQKPTIGQRVKTKYGPGTVSGFERTLSVKKPAIYPQTFAPGDRVAVTLDNPAAWPCHSVTSGAPYFFPAELSEVAA